MKCERCEGFMLADDFIDMEESGGMWLRAWRCLSCGHAVDPLMAANRQRQALLQASYVEHEKRAPDADREVIVASAA